MTLCKTVAPPECAMAKTRTDFDVEALVAAPVQLDGASRLLRDVAEDNWPWPVPLELQDGQYDLDKELSTGHSCS